MEEGSPNNRSLPLLPTSSSLFLLLDYHDPALLHPDIELRGSLSSVSGMADEIDMDAEKEVENGKNTSKKKRRTKKPTRPKFAFQTRSSVDVLDDGYRWRKYGRKAVKNNSYSRSYYRCTRYTCDVKKQVQRLTKDSGIVVTTYEGTHNHPCEELMETLSPLLKQMHSLSRF